MNDARRERQRAKKKIARLWKAANKALGLTEGTSLKPLPVLSTKGSQSRTKKAKGRGQYSPVPRDQRVGCTSLIRKDNDVWYPEHRAIKKVWDGSKYVPV